MKYVVAEPWDETKPDDLCIYSFGNDIQSGTLEDAKNFLAYVNRQEEGQWAIYEVSFRKI